MKTAVILRTLLLAGAMAAEAANPAAIERASFLRQEGNAVVLKAEQGRIRISVLRPNLVRVQATTKTSFAPSLMVEAGFVKADWPACPFELRNAPDTLTLSTAAMKVRVAKSPFGLELLSREGVRLLRTARHEGMKLDHGAALTFEMTPADHFFGFGYMRKCLDARGHTLTWTRSYRHNEATVPFFMNPRGYAFFSNNTWKNDFDFTGPDSFRISTEAGDVDFFLMTGGDFGRLLDLYTDLTGKPQMAPKWALGLEHRARYYDDAETVLNTARLFRRRHIPCEIIGLEPGWEALPYSMQWRWSPERFPDPAGMIRKLKRMGYQFDLWESGKAPKQNLLDPAVRLAWFAQRAVALTNWGVDMFKQDDPYPRAIKSVGMEPAVFSEGTVTDRVYAPGEIITVANTFYSHTLFTEWRKLTARRPVVQFHAYNASVASQRWPYQWAGDFGTGWGLFNASLSGHALVNADARSANPDARHLDFFMSAGPVNDCWAYTIEPWHYSDRLLEVCRMYASLRARLLPYLYTAMREAHDTGLPVLRPLVLRYPHDPVTYDLGTEFFLGDSLLVATSLRFNESGKPERVRLPEGPPTVSEFSTPLYLPRGRWIDYWTGREYVVVSNQWAKCTFPSWAGGPLLVKAGSIIPLAQVKQYTAQRPDELITLDVYPDTKETTHRLYEDDGVSFGYEQGERANTQFGVVQTAGRIRLTLEPRTGDYSGKPKHRDYLLKVHSLLAPARVMVDGRELRPVARDRLLFTSAGRGWYYDAAASKIILKPHSGWRFAASERDPAGTYPLTPAEEAVLFEQAEDHSAKAARIEITLNPDRAARLGPAAKIRLKPENPRVLADGQSRVRVAVLACDESDNVVTSFTGPVQLALEGKGRIPPRVRLEQGRGEVFYTAPAEPGHARLSANARHLTCKPLKLEALHGSLCVLVNPVKKVRIPGKGQWLGRRFDIAVSVRDPEGRRLAAQLPVHLTLRDYKDRELIEREAVLIDGEAEFPNVTYRTRPEKFIISATAPGLEAATVRAFENGWRLPDDYLTNDAIKAGLEKALPH